MGKYRFDSRTEKEFRQAIKISHKNEVEIAVRICIDQYKTTGVWPELAPNGIDITGSYIKHDSKVTNDADFIIGSKKTEITMSNGMCPRYFHEKIPKVKRCIEEKWDIVFVNGFKTEHPLYIIINSKELEEKTEFSKKEFGENLLHPGSIKITNKPAYKYKLEWFNLKPLPPIIKEIPKSYKEILNLVRG